MLNINKFANYSNINFNSKALDNDLAIKNKDRGVKMLLTLISTVAELKNVTEDNGLVGLYKIEKNGNDWDDSGEINEKPGQINGHIIKNGLASLDLSKINLGATIKGEFSKIAPYNKNLMRYYYKYIKPLRNDKLYIIKSTKDGLNQYRELDRSELVSIAFHYEDLYNDLKDNQDLYNTVTFMDLAKNF